MSHWNGTYTQGQESKERNRTSVPDDVRPGLPRQRALDVLGVRDDGLGAAMLEIRDDRLDLGGHAPPGEVRSLGGAVDGSS